MKRISMKHLTTSFLVAVFAAVGVAGSVNRSLEDPKTQLKIGDAAPEWNDLVGTDDKQHSLRDLHDKQVIVVCFTCNSCPYAVDYEDRTIALHRKYSEHPQGVAIVAINANRKPAETLDRMKERSTAKEFPFVYLIDETQKVAESWGARFTPEYFVLNKERNVIYKGALDDKTDPAQVQIRHVELAIEAALKGETPEIQEVPARGCLIPYKRARK
jgi:peroxiredoxin